MLAENRPERSRTFDSALSVSLCHSERSVPAFAPGNRASAMSGRHAESKNLSSILPMLSRANCATSA